MQKISLEWGTRQETMPSLGAAGESRSAELIIDVSGAEARIPGAVYSIHMRRADGWIYPAAVGLRADAGQEVRYILEEPDMAVSGALWATIRADAPEPEGGESAAGGGAGTGERRAEWSIIGWVSPGLYEGAQPPKPDWVSEVLAFANAFDGIKARIALLPPNARPAAAFTREPDGMRLVLSLPDTSGIGDGGHAIFGAEDEDDLLTLAGATIGDQAITMDGAVYMCVEGDPSLESAWVRLTDDGAVMDRMDEIAAELEAKSLELGESIDLLEQAAADLDSSIAQMEQAVAAVSGTLWQAQQIEGLLKGTGAAITAAEPGADYARPPLAIGVTVTPGMWDEGAADIADERIHADTAGLLTLAPGASAGQYALYGQTQPRVSAQWDGGLTISAGGDAPEETLSLQLLILG
ncbi:MAG: hypothetical protein LBS11_10340 [Oscillospiraceae bacterium]|nr:hypothetical protein [Oscillospiraceae bacterium]